MEMKIAKEEAVTVIGEATSIRGRLEGSENLTVRGRIEGSIHLSKLLTVEPGGVVQADISVREAIIYGVVEGNVEALDLVHITAGGQMIGDIKAPRVILVDGSIFRGSIDMGKVDTGPARK